MFYHFRKLASLFRALLSVLLNQTIDFLLFKLFKCLQGLDNLFQKIFVKFRYFSVFAVLCCHFVVVVLQKDVMMIKGDENEDVMFSRLISYKFNGFKTVVS